MASSPAQAAAPDWRHVLRDYLYLGLTSFGGPVAHLAYFRTLLVERRRWIDDAGYAEMVALCQAMPGPASTQTAILLGLHRAGWLGGLIAWLAFTLPSALLMILFAAGINQLPGLREGDYLHGFKLVVVAVVAHAVWTMAGKLCPDTPRRIMAAVGLVVAFGGSLIGPPVLAQLAAILVGGVLGTLMLCHSAQEHVTPPKLDLVGVPLGITLLLLFFALLIVLPLLREFGPSFAVIDGFYRTGAVVYGGGHVVLPLIRAELVPPGLISDDVFLAGYGAAQALPGPLFAFAAFLGYVVEAPLNGVLGATVALFFLQVPSFLLLLGVLPFWTKLRERPGIGRALQGVAAAVVGLLAAAWLNPILPSAFTSPLDIVIAGLAFAALYTGRVPVVAVVAVTALVGAFI